MTNSRPTGLYEDVDQVTVLIHRAPEILALTVDRHEDFVQEPRISESTLPSLQLPSVVGAELPAPLANGFVGHDDSSFGQQMGARVSNDPGLPDRSLVSHHGPGPGASGRCQNGRTVSPAA